MWEEKHKEMIVASDTQTTRKKKKKKTTEKEKRKENTSRLSQQQQQQRSGVVCGGLLLAPLSISLRWAGRSASPKDGSASFACLWINPLHSWKSSTVLFVVSKRLFFWALCAAHFLLETKLFTIMPICGNFLLVFLPPGWENLPKTETNWFRENSCESCRQCLVDH